MAPAARGRTRRRCVFAALSFNQYTVVTPISLPSGLERYRPVETRSTRALGRFPMRNKFISDYILQVTGKHRTPKQVGSRLQQLRDTCEGKRSECPCLRSTVVSS